MVLSWLVKKKKNLFQHDIVLTIFYTSLSPESTFYLSYIVIQSKLDKVLFL